MPPLLLKLSLSILRIFSQASFFLELQRLFLTLIHPHTRTSLPLTESHLLRSVTTPLLHRFIPDSLGNFIHLLHLPNPQNSNPIILLHGHSMSAAFWFRNFDYLVSLGYSVYAIDLLGWGRSQRPKFIGRTAEESVEWSLSSLAGVIRHLDLAKFTLVGHSLGGYLALEYAMRHDSQVEQLVLVSPAASSRTIPVSRALYFSLPPQTIVRRGGLLGYLFFLWKYPREQSYISDRLREYTYLLAMQQPASGEVAIRPIIQLKGVRTAECVRPTVEHLRLVHCPVKVIVGERDSSMPVEGVWELYKAMKKKGFRVGIEVVKGADHCPMLEKPDRFGKVMERVAKERGSMCVE